VTEPRTETCRGGRIPAGAISASRIAAMLAAARGWRHYRRTEGGSYYGESVRQLPSRDFNETLEKVDPFDCGGSRGCASAGIHQPQRVLTRLIPRSRCSTTGRSGRRHELGALLAIKEKGLHRPFAFDLERAAGLEAEPIAQCKPHRGGDMDMAGQAVALHALGGVYGVAPDEADPRDAAPRVLAAGLLVARGQPAAAIPLYQAAIRLGQAPWASMSAEMLVQLNVEPSA
jgi:hypothetical protein